jgi:hypothetical protein
MVHENGDYSDEEDTLDEWLFDNHRIDRYEEAMDDIWDDKRDQWYWGE